MMTRSATIVSDGVLKMDAGSIFGPVPKVQWENTVATDRKNRLTMGLNCLLVQIGARNVLIDTGVGTKDVNGRREEFGLVPSRLLKDLRAMQLSAKDIDTVVLSRLDFDHCGGCTRLDRSGNYVPTFSKAMHYVQASCFEDACNLNERAQVMHVEEDYMPLEERGQFTFIDGDSEIFPGLEVLSTSGPCRGHQIVLITLGGEKICYLGDLVPTTHHLELASIPAFDQYPADTLEMKRSILDQAEKDGWLLVFAHGHDQKAGYLERRNGNRTFRPIDLSVPVAT